MKEENPFADHTDYEQENKNNMAYWFPLLKFIKMRVPKTILVHTGDCDLSPMADYNAPINYKPFLQRLKSAIKEIGLPCFLRTGATSDKHSWGETCFVEKLDDKDLYSRITKLVEHSFMANIAGLPLDFSIWAVREMIPTKPLFHAFNNMPITKERRLFIRDGKVVCNHPYWPEEAFEHYKKPEDFQSKLFELQELAKEDERELTLMAEYVGKFFTGYWSVDFLQDKDGKWWLTDMAVGERSYHFPKCQLTVS